MDQNQPAQDNPESSDKPQDTVVGESVSQEVESSQSTDNFGSQSSSDTSSSDQNKTSDPVDSSNEPAIPSTTPLPQNTNDVVSTTPVFNQTPVVQLAAKQPRKSLLWLWVTLGAVLLIIIGLVIGYVVVKGAGDTVAKTYTTAAKTYIEDVYDASKTSAESPNDVVKAMQNVDKPQLEEVFLSDLSSDYKTASELDASIASKVEEIESQLTQYGNVYDLYTELLAAEDTVDQTASTADAVATTLIKYLNLVDKIIKDKSDVPSDLKEDVASFTVANSELKDAYTELLAAYTAKSQSRYNAAVSEVTTKTKTFQTTIGKITVYYNNLAEKISTVTKDLKSYVDTVK